MHFGPEHQAMTLQEIARMSGTTRSADCPNPDDPSLCRISMATALQEPMVNWIPVYDGAGKLTNPNPNVHVTTYTCSVCSMTWQTTMTPGQPPAGYEKLAATEEK
jgi:hypothetical protein